LAAADWGGSKRDGVVAGVRRSSRGGGRRQRHLVQATTSEPPVAILAPLPLAAVGERNGRADLSSPAATRSTTRSASIVDGAHRRPSGARP
jgi:hypothetical protein